MPYILIRHKVKNYARWKPVFDEHGATREENGSWGGHLFRNADDPNEIVILLEWDSLERARKFVKSEVRKRRCSGLGLLTSHMFISSMRLKKCLFEAQNLLIPCPN